MRLYWRFASATLMQGIPNPFDLLVPKPELQKRQPGCELLCSGLRAGSEQTESRMMKRSMFFSCRSTGVHYFFCTNSGPGFCDLCILHTGQVSGGVWPLYIYPQQVHRHFFISVLLVVILISQAVENIRMSRHGGITATYKQVRLSQIPTCRGVLMNLRAMPHGGFEQPEKNDTTQQQRHCESRPGVTKQSP